MPHRRWINVGVHNQLITTKSRLKAWLRDDPKGVTFYATALGEVFYGNVDDIPEGAALSVVGPDPHNDRRWYATVYVENGKVVCR